MTDAREYGVALFLITEEDGTTERVAEDVRLAAEIFRQNPEYSRLLDTPALAKEERTQLIDESMSGLDERLKNLIKILTERHATHGFTRAADAYLEKYDEARGILRAEAISAVPLSREQADRLTKRLSEKCGKHVVLKNTTDPSILGGIKLRYGTVQLDGSVKTRLDAFEKSLRNTVI